MGRQLIDFTKSQGKIEDQIFELIRFGETEFLDFKQEWHKCRAELLHDILYLANARSDNDRYIVFGINDACNNFCKTNFWFGAHREELERYVDGVTDEDYKQKQNDLTQMLDNCSLNKNLSRCVHLHKFDLSPFWTLIRDSKGRFIKKERKLLILHIENVALKPFFLLIDFCDKKGNKNKIVRNGAIYSRHCDGNVPTNSTADDSEMELMFRERFGINRTPRENALVYLRYYNAWEFDDTHKFIYYVKDPKYRIKCKKHCVQENWSKLQSYLKQFFSGELKHETFYLEYDGVDIKIVCDAVIMKDEQRIIHYPTYLDISCEWEIRRRRDLDEQTNFHPLVIDICEIIQRHGGKNFNSKYTVPESAQKAGIPVWNMQLTPRECNDSSNGITVPMESMYLLRN